MRKRLIAVVSVCTVILLITACGEQVVETPEDQIVPDVYETEAETDQADEESENGIKAGEVMTQEDSFNPQSFDDDSYYKGSGQLPREITKQIEIFVKQRDVWLSERQPRSGNYYAWNDLNLDESLELICSWYDGTGWYSVSQIYTVNSSGEVELVTEIHGDLSGSPDLLLGVELYADAQEQEEMPKHFYIRSQDHIPDGSDYYKADMVVTFTAELTEWQKEIFRSCLKKYSDASRSELIDTNYYNADGKPVSQKEWDCLEEEFLKDKELIAPSFAWNRLLPHTYDENGKGTLSDKELGEDLETLYISWQELISENTQENE